jgi:ubiquinone/menaquinone biosynthesis C-methylase UbiE
MDECGTTTACGNCQAIFSSIAGIVDFVEGRADTALGVHEYDAQKAVSFDLSKRLFFDMKERSAGAIRDHLGNVLEFGAGTGLLTLAMLKHSSFDHAVITDISSAMLRVCAERLPVIGSVRQSKVTLATFSGQEPILVERAFDFCIGSSVLHHVLDCASLLAVLGRALKTGGKAIFTEPAAAFHDALTLAMSDTIAQLEAAGEAPPGLPITAAWVQQTRFRLRAAPSELAALEDKHIFRREMVAEMGRSVGFADVSIAPFRHDPLGELAAAKYLHELGAADTEAMFMPIYREHARRRFAGLRHNDLSAMYLIVLTR